MSNRYEQWHTASGDKDLVRCDCWRHMTANYDGIAPSNGWAERDRYPHADYCDNPDRKAVMRIRKH